MNPKRYRAAAIISIFVFCLSSLSMVFVATRWGLGASPDSVVYLVGARNLANGSGFGMPTITGSISPITHHAPFYSFILAMGELVGISAMQWGRFIHLLLMTITIWILIQIFQQWHRQDSKPAELAALFAVALLLSPVFMVEIFSMAWTEGLFITLFMLSLLYIGRYLKDPTSRWLIAAGVITALAVLTRYAGVAIIPTYCLVIILFSPQIFSKRMVHSVVFGVVSLVPLALWMLRNQLAAGTATSREVIYHPVEKGQISQALTTISSWLLIPATAPTVIKIVVILFFSVCLLLLIRRVQQSTIIREPNQLVNPLPGTILALLVFIPVYFIFLGFSLSFFDANTPLDGRILSPIYASLLIVTVFLSQQALLFEKKWRNVVNGAAVLVTIVIFVNLANSTSFVKTAFHNGLGFSSPIWRDSQALAMLEELPISTPVYTNAPEPIQLFSDRPVTSLPRRFEAANRQVNPDYPTEIAQLQNTLASGQAVAVFFTGLNRPNLTDSAEIELFPGIQKIQIAEDGVIFGSSSIK